MTEKYVLITVIICALCTQATRWLPFLLFGGKKEVPRIVRYLGAVLPAAIMAVLVVYCLKGVTPLAYPYGLLLPSPFCRSFSAWPLWWCCTCGRGTPWQVLRWARCVIWCWCRGCFEVSCLGLAVHNI